MCVGNNVKETSLVSTWALVISILNTKFDQELLQSEHSIDIVEDLGLDSVDVITLLATLEEKMDFTLADTSLMEKTVLSEIFGAVMIREFDYSKSEIHEFFKKMKNDV